MLVIMCPSGTHRQVEVTVIGFLQAGSFPGQVWTYFWCCMQVPWGVGGHCQVSSVSNHLCVESLGDF